MTPSRGSFKPAVVGMVLVVMAAGLGISLLVWKQVRSVRPTNLILITVDTLRADHLGAYGYRRATSPNLDALAKESLLYRRAFSQAPETNPSLSSLMTSHYPHETKVLGNIHQLQPGATTLAEILKASGWRTGAVVSNFCLRRGAGFEQGFDDYDDTMDDRGSTEWFAIERVAPKTTAAAVEWLRHHRRDRFFLWVHYIDPHAPYTSPSPFNAMFTDDQNDGPAGEGRSLPFLPEGRGTGGIPIYAKLGTHADPRYYVSQYDGEIRYMDHWVGKLIDEIRSLGLMENTLLLVTADHGEGMGEHEYYFNHREYLYSGLIHVPLLVRLPGRSLGSRTIDTPVALVDVLPTVLQVLALDGPKRMKGRNLLNPEPRPIWAESHYLAGKAAVISAGRKLISNQNTLSLYDLDTDFYETRDLIQDGAVKDLGAAKTMRDAMGAIDDQDDLGLGAPVTWAILPEDIEKLRSLGYVQ